MGNKSIEEQLAELKIIGPSLMEILESCPHDNHRNFNRIFSEELFYQKLFVTTKEYEDLLKQFEDTLFSKSVNNRLIFFSGFSGCGKTTFIHKFMNSNEDDGSIVPIYIDFEKFSSIDPNTDYSGRSFYQGVSTLGNNIQNTIRDILERFLPIEMIPHIYRSKNSVTASIQDAMINMNDIDKLGHCDPPCHDTKVCSCTPQKIISRCIKLMIENDWAFHKYLSPTTREQMKNIALSGFSSEQDFNSFVFSLSTTETFMIFCMMLFFKIKGQRKFVILFDNLDNVDLLDLSKSFQTEFINALNIVTQISVEESLFNKKIHFTNSFKFVFCLRDANNVYIKAHLQDAIGNTVIDTNFTKFLGGDFYKMILEKRLDFANELCIEGEEAEKVVHLSSIINTIGSFINAQDKYFEDAIVRLFNCDIKKVVKALYMLSGNVDLVKFTAIIEKDFSRTSVQNPDYFFGLRGGVLFWITKYLIDEDFLGEMTRKVVVDKVYGSCLIHRMILTVLINRTSFDWKTGRPFGSIRDTCSLYDFITEMNFSCVYPCKDIVGKLEEMFFYHYDKMIHLLTVHNKKILSKNSFKEEIAQVSRLAKLISSDRSKDSQLREDIIRKLDDIQIKVNPSGFALVRYILPHFEYYSNLAKCELPLFSLGINKDKNGSFIFLQNIEKVLKIVKDHFELNNKFFIRHFGNENNNCPDVFNADYYRKSSFSFKYKSDNSKMTMGEFHMTRVINFHLIYLDRFRLYLADAKCNSNKDVATINRKILEKMKDYNKLFKSSVDQSVLKRYHAIWNSGISYIEADQFERLERRAYELCYEPINASSSEGYIVPALTNKIDDVWTVGMRMRESNQ